MDGVEVHELNGESYEDWPEAKEAAKQCGITVRQLNAYVRAGRIAKYRCSDSTLRFRPADVDLLVVALQAEEERSVGELRYAHGEIKDVLARCVSLLKQAETDKRELMKLVTEPMREAIGFLKDVNAVQKERIVDLEKLQEESWKAREESFSRDHERKLNEIAAIGSEERRNQMLELFRSHAPTLFRSVSRAVGLDVGQDDRIAKILELVEGIPPETAHALCDLNLVDERQRQIIEELYPREQPAAPKADRDAEPASVDPQPTSDPSGPSPSRSKAAAPKAKPRAKRKPTPPAARAPSTPKE